MDLGAGRADSTLDCAEPVLDQDLDWVWPATDTFTDDSIACRTYQTCSELGSRRIRLVKIRPGRAGDIIECDTKICFLPNAGKYTALSYTLDSPVPRCQIVVDTQPRQVTVNLWRFLWQARKLPARYSGWLWIDSLSINQSDPWEKLEQVGIISHIFDGAKMTVVWLGRAYEDSDKAMRALKTKYSSLSSRALRAMWAPPLGPAILRLCERAYWQRLWVLQELTYSHAIDLMCGDRHLGIECLEQLLFTDSFDERVKAKVKALKKSSAARMVGLIPVSVQTSLWKMIFDTSYLRCNDPRDKVYAILKLVVPESNDIEADYTNTVPNLMNQILRNVHAFEEPRTLYSVYSQCIDLESTFRMSPGSIFKTDDNALSVPSGLLYHLIFKPATRLPEIKTVTTLKDLRMWCKYYKHQAVARMIRQELPKRWGLYELDLELAKHPRHLLVGDDSSNISESDQIRNEIARTLRSFESIYRAY